MPIKNSSESIHKQRLKAIRPYVNFNYNLNKELTAYQKRKIKKYHDEISALTNRPYSVYRPRTKKHLKTAQEFAQHENYLPDLKVAFIPTDGVNKPKVKFNRKGEMSVTAGLVTSIYIALDKFQLIDNAESHVNAVIDDYPKIKSFTILAGRFEIPAGESRRTIAEAVAKLTAKYTEEKGNHYHGNWLHGLSGYTFNDQSDFGDYLNTKQNSKENAKKERRNAKRRARYKRYGK